MFRSINTKNTFITLVNAFTSFNHAAQCFFEVWTSEGALLYILHWVQQFATTLETDTVTRWYSRRFIRNVLFYSANQIRSGGVFLFILARFLHTFFVTLQYRIVCCVLKINVTSANWCRNSILYCKMHFRVSWYCVPMFLLSIWKWLFWHVNKCIASCRVLMNL